MLMQTPEMTIVRKQRRIIQMQRRRISVLSVITLILAIISIGIIVHNMSEQKKAEDIVLSARQIIADAEVQANVQANLIKEEAIKEATEIKLAAQNDAREVLTTAINAKIDDIEVLLAITESESGNQPIEGRAAVASTILNRVENDLFPDTIEEVVYSPGQFQPVYEGTLQTTNISKPTYEATKIALSGIDYSNGALYFYNPEASSPSNRRWFNTLQTTTIIGGHVFKK